MKTMVRILDNRTPKYVWRFSMLFLLALCIATIWVDNADFFIPFFAIPIVLSSWYGSRRSGVFLALLSGTAMTLSNQLALVSSLPYVIAFSILGLLVANFRSVYKVEVTAAETDGLTGLHNKRSFCHLLDRELERSVRYQHIFSLAYLDVDNFKYINDSYGHAIGDRLLSTVAECLESGLRKTDVVARLGGDEFACLLPETRQDNAIVVFEKAKKNLTRKMDQYGWPVSFSIGLVTFENIPVDTDEALKITDDLMYSVKNGGKNRIAYGSWKRSVAVS